LFIYFIENRLFLKIKKVNLVIFKHSIHNDCLYFTRLIFQNYPHLLFRLIFPGKADKLKMAPYLLKVNIPIVTLDYRLISD